MLVRDVRKIFLTGLLVLIPIVGTISLIIWLFNMIDSIFRVPIENILGFRIIGIGVVLTVLIVFWTGVIATNYLGKKMIYLVDKMICKIPMVSIIYSSIKQVIDTIFMKKKDDFKSAVVVQYPSKGIYTIGFVTADAPDEICQITGKKMKSIFIPTTPNPTSGMFVMIPEKDIMILNISVETAVKLVISGGLLHLENKNEQKKKG